MTSIAEPPVITEHKLQTLKRTICRNWADHVFEEFAERCNSLRLDPFLGQVVGEQKSQNKRRKNQQGKWTDNWVPVLYFHITIDGLRAIADRAKDAQGVRLYEGQTMGEWSVDGKNWVKQWLENRPPRVARVGIHRRGFREPIWGVAHMDDYRPDRLTGWWVDEKSYGAHQLLKCAEADGLKTAFSSEFVSGVPKGIVSPKDSPGGIYTPIDGAPENEPTVAAPPPPQATPGIKMVEAYEAAGVDVVLLSDLLGYDPYQVRDDDLVNLRPLLKSVRARNANPDGDGRDGVRFVEELVREQEENGRQHINGPVPWKPRDCKMCRIHISRRQFEQQQGLCDGCLRKTAQAVTTGDVIASQNEDHTNGVRELTPQEEIELQAAKEMQPTGRDISSSAALPSPGGEATEAEIDSPYDLRNEPPPHTPPPREATKEVLNEMRRGRELK